MHPEKAHNQPLIFFCINYKEKAKLRATLSPSDSYLRYILQPLYCVGNNMANAYDIGNKLTGQFNNSYVL